MESNSIRSIRVLRAMQSFDKNNLNNLENGNDLEKRRKIKRYFFHKLIFYKMYCRLLEEGFQSGKHTHADWRDMALKTGEMVGSILSLMVDFKIKLSENEYKTLFNISHESWKANCHRKKPGSALDVTYVTKLSTEPFIDYFIDAMLLDIEKHPKIQQKLNYFLEYELGIPIAPVTH